MGGPHLPRLARALLERLTAAEDRAFVIADLDAHAGRIAAGQGDRAARRWYRAQLWKALPSLSVDAARRALGRSSHLGRDVHFSLRTVRTRPLYAIGFAGTLGLGLASALLVSAVAWSLWLSPLPLPESHELVRIYERENSRALDEPNGLSWVSPPVFTDLELASLSTLTGVVAISDQAIEVSRSRGGTRAQIDAYRVTDGFFEVLGLRPLHGRLEWQEGLREVIVSAAYWERELGGDPSEIGRRRLELDGEPHRVVGVVDLSGGYPRAKDLVLPLHFTEDALTEGMRGARYLTVVGRLQEGATVARAEAEVSTFISRLGETHPQNAGWGSHVIGLQDDLTAPFRDTLRLLLAAGVVFLFLAGVNVAGLVAARGVERRPEQSLRRALGATRGRISTAATIEGLVLGSVGVAAAIVLALLLLPLLVGVLPAGLPRRSQVALGWGTVATFAALGLAVSVGIGWLGHHMSRGGRSLSPGRRSTPRGAGGRQLLVVGQISLTTLLLLSSALVVGRMAQLRGTELGFVPDEVLYAPLVLPESQYSSPEAVWSFVREALDRLEARGVLAAALTNPPLSGSNMNFGYRAEGTTEQAWAQYHIVTERAFEVLGIVIEEGRGFEPGSEAPEIIVNRALAREHFADGEALGRTIRLLEVDRVVVGVTASTRHFGPDQPPPKEFFVPFAQDPWSVSHLVVRGDAEAGRRLQDVVASIDPGLPAPAVSSYAGRVSAWFTTLRLQVGVVGALGLIGALLAGLGLYTIIAYHVRSRSREIGIRRALGAPSGDLFGQALAQATGLGLVGAVIGLVSWVWVGGWVAGLLQIESAGGWRSVAAVLAAVAVVAIGASVLPAIRSLRIDPREALRAD